MTTATANATATATGPTPIRTAIIGFGLSGRVFHAPLIAADPAYTVAAIVTSNDERRAQAEAAYPDAVIHDSYPALLESIDARGGIDLVVIGTPPALHREQAIAALERDLSVVMDKPFAPSAEDARAIIEAAAASAGVLSVFQNRRWDSDFLTLRSLIEAGDLGTVHTFESRFEGWSSRGPGGWKATTSVADGGGTLFDLGPHLLDQAVSLFGPISDVYAELVRHTPGEEADEDSFVSLLHENGVRTRAWMSRRCPAPGARFRVTGERGAFVSQGKDPQEGQLSVGILPSDSEYGWVGDPQAMQVHTAPQPQESGPPIAARSVSPEMVRGDYPDFYRRLAAAIRGEGEVPVDPYESAQVLALIETIHAEFPVRARE